MGSPFFKRAFAMLASISLALLAVTATLAFSGVGRANVTVVRTNVEQLCPTRARPCDCTGHVRTCLPTCYIAPRLECTPT
jgi:hypothetical protein